MPVEFLNGRSAKVYLSDTAYTAAGLVDLENTTDDFDNPDEAETAQVMARDLDYVLNMLGIKTTSISGSILRRKTNGTGAALLQTSYDAQSPLYVVILPKAKSVSGVSGVKFVGVVSKFQSPIPQVGPRKWEFTILPTDPDNMPTRVTTPLS